MALGTPYGRFSFFASKCACHAWFDDDEVMHVAACRPEHERVLEAAAITFAEELGIPIEVAECECGTLNARIAK